MKRIYWVSGVDEQGDEITLELEATSIESAKLMAEKKGLKVTTIEPDSSMEDVKLMKKFGLFLVGVTVTSVLMMLNAPSSIVEPLRFCFIGLILYIALEAGWNTIRTRKRHFKHDQ